MSRPRHALPVGDDGMEVDEGSAFDPAERTRRRRDLDLALDGCPVVIPALEIVIAELDLFRGADSLEPPSGDVVARGDFGERFEDLVPGLEPDENPGALFSRLHSRIIAETRPSSRRRRSAAASRSPLRHSRCR